MFTKLTLPNKRDLCAGLILLGLANIVLSNDTWTVAPQEVSDQKAVFATVQSLKTVAARARLNGTIAALHVSEGDAVQSGESIANVGDDKLALQIASLDSRISGLTAQKTQAQVDLERAQALLSSGAVSQARLDALSTAFNVADNALKSAVAERDVVLRQVKEGSVLAPVSGRILSVPVTPGTVILPGETVAVIAEENFILRLEVPERHARFMKIDDPILVDAMTTQDSPTADSQLTGRITKVYPEIVNGRVMADAKVEGLGNYFVGERIRVWISIGKRQAILIPESFLTTRGGIDFVHLLQNESVLEVPVQRGHSTSNNVEILSGLQSGDRLVLP